MTFFLVKNYADEYLKALDKDFKGNIMEPDTDETVAQTADGRLFPGVASSKGNTESANAGLYERVMSD